jgi:hypothetical protein
MDCGGESLNKFECRRENNSGILTVQGEFDEKLPFLADNNLELGLLRYGKLPGTDEAP